MFASPLPPQFQTTPIFIPKVFQDPIDFGVFSSLKVDRYPNDLKNCRGMTAAGRPVIGFVTDGVTFDGVTVGVAIRSFDATLGFNLKFSFVLSEVYDTYTGAAKLTYPSPFHVAIVNKWKPLGYHKRQPLYISGESTVGAGVTLQGKVSVAPNGSVSISIFNGASHCHTAMNEVITVENEKRVMDMQIKNAKVEADNIKYADVKGYQKQELWKQFHMNVFEHCSDNTANTLCDHCPALFSTSFSVKRFLPNV